MTKQSSYQKLKQKNEKLLKQINELHGDIRSLVLQPESERSFIVKTNVIIDHQISELIWAGGMTVLENEPIYKANE